MRIKDWSSDVCSSDLPTTHSPGSFAAGFEGPGADTVQAIVQITSLLFDEPWDLDRLVFALALGRLGIETAEIWHQIGRAHVCTPVTTAHIVCRLLLEKQTTCRTHIRNPAPSSHHVTSFFFVLKHF